MAQQTAVEWLFEQIGNGNITSEKTDCGYLITINNDCYEQAKAMEKEQIITAWRNGDNDSIYNFKELDELAEQYYNETYDK